MLDVLGDGKTSLCHLQRTCVLTSWTQAHSHVNQSVCFIRALADFACYLQRELALMKRLGKTYRCWDHRLVLIVAARQHQGCQTVRQTLALIQLTEEDYGLLSIHRALHQVTAQ